MKKTEEKSPGYWFVAVKESKKTEKKGAVVITITARLMWHDNKENKSAEFHRLTGPTAERSLEDFAKNLNANGKLPDFCQRIKCRADGVNLNNR